MAGAVEVKSEPKKAEKQRLYLLDNAKFILNICVAVEHLAPCLGCEGRPMFHSVYGSGLKIFMMPTWTFISGYCSSSDLSNVRKVDGCIKVIAIYVLSQLFWLLMSRYADAWYGTTKWGMELSRAGHAYSVSPWKVEDWLVPFWQLWYLRDLAVWRLVLPFWARLKYPLLSAWVVSSFVDSFYLYGGTFDTGGMVNRLSLDMIWMYFPLYYFGTMAKERKWEVQEGLRYRIAGIIVLTACIAVPILEPPDMDAIWRFDGHSSIVASLTGEGFFGNSLQMLVRLMAYIIIAAAVVAFLHVIPRRNVPVMTNFGERSLANYIFHPMSGMFLSYVGVYGANAQGASHPPWGPWLGLLLGVVTSVFWMSPWVWHVVWPICDPPIHYLLKPQTAETPKAIQTKRTCAERCAALSRALRTFFGCNKKQDDGKLTDIEV